MKLQKVGVCFAHKKVKKKNKTTPTDIFCFCQTRDSFFEIPFHAREYAPKNYENIKREFPMRISRTWEALENFCFLRF